MYKIKRNIIGKSNEKRRFFDNYAKSPIVFNFQPIWFQYGSDINLISKYTGLTINEINKL